MLIEQQALRAVVRAVVAAGGSGAAEASVVADHLVEANLAGHDSHGVGMIPAYVKGLRSGALRPNRHVQMHSDQGCMLVLDGGQGYGQVIGRESMELGIERARAHGICLLALRNTFHLGRIGTYAEQCAAVGLVSMHHVNVIGHAPLVAPFRGSDRRFSTNPYTCAIPPTAATPPAVLDMATSKVAYGKVRVARERGERVPEGALIDVHGAPTTDPEVMYTPPLGAMCAFGEHKGYALAVMNELLAGVLSGGGTIATETRTDAIINNMLSIVIDPARLIPAAAYAEGVDAFVAHVKASPPAQADRPVLVPGDPERAARAGRAARGIELEDDVWSAILAAGVELGLGEPELRALAGA